MINTSAQYNLWLFLRNESEELRRFIFHAETIIDFKNCRIKANNLTTNVNKLKYDITNVGLWSIRNCSELCKDIELSIHNGNHMIEEEDIIKNNINITTLKITALNFVCFYIKMLLKMFENVNLIEDIFDIKGDESIINEY